MSNNPLICECCWYLKRIEVPAHWMEWDEWLCDECARQAIEDDEIDFGLPEAST